MYDRTAIMKTAWAQYRQMSRYRRAFDRKLFADVLRFTWDQAKRRVRYAAEAEARRARAIEEFSRLPVAPLAPLSELEERIDALKYLSFRYNIGRMAQKMRAEAALAAGAGR